MSLPSSSQIRQMTSARDVLNARDAANAALRRSSSPAIREQAGAVHTTAQRRLDELQGRDPQRIQAQADRSAKERADLVRQSLGLLPSKERLEAKRKAAEVRAQVFGQKR